MLPVYAIIAIGIASPMTSVLRSDCRNTSTTIIVLNTIELRISVLA